MLIPLALIAASLAASMVASVVGFGGAIIMLPVLVWAVGVQDAIPILTVAQLIGNGARVALNRHELAAPVAWRFLLGAVPLAVLGGFIFATAPAAALVRLLGVFLVIVVVYRHTRWGTTMQFRLGGFVPLGATAGLLSALLGTVGPLVAPFFLAYGLVKGAYIGTEALTAAVMHLTKLGVYGGYSLLNADALLTGAGIGVVMIAGTWLGTHLLKRLPAGVFPYIIEATMLAAGIIFIVTG